MPCNDRFIDHLKSFGYNVLRLPKADVRPGQLLHRTGSDLNRLGELATVFWPGEQIPLPTVKENVAAGNVSGQQTGNMKANIGLSILGGVIGAMGGSALQLGLQYQGAQTVAFEFSDVVEDSLEVTALDQFLGNADVNLQSKHVATLLDANEVYVTTVTLKSKKISVSAKKSDGSELKLSIPVIKGIVGGGIEVSGASEESSVVTYAGASPLVFGFQAVQLFFDDGQYRAFKPAKTELVMRAVGRAEDRAKFLTTDGAFARLGSP